MKNLLVLFLLVCFFKPQELRCSEAMGLSEDQNELPKLEDLKISPPAPEKEKTPVVTLSDVLDSSEVYCAGL